MSDNLEKYFKKHLSDDTPGEGNWNVPSDDVWDKVEPRIRNQRGVFIPWRYMYIAGLVLLAGITYMLWPAGSGDMPSQTETAAVAGIDDENSKTQISNPKTTGTKQTLETKDDQNPEELRISGKSTQAGINSDKEEVSQVAASDPLNEDVSDKVTTNATPGTPSGKADITVASDDDREDLVAATVADDSDEFIRDGFVVNPLSSKSAGLIAHGFDRDALKAESREVAYFELEKPDSSPEPFDNKGKFAVGAFFSPSFNTTYVTGDGNRGELKTVRNMYLYSGNWGAELKYFISDRFAILAGLERSEIKSWSKSYIDFAYDASTEEPMPGGKKENTSPVPMSTPFGTYETEVTFQFSGDQEFPDGEPMNSILETHQEIRYLTIPLGAEYNMIRFSRFSWFTEGGLRYNRAIRDATEFTSRIIHNGDEMDVTGEKLMNSPAYTENYLSYYAGTGLSYQLSEKFQLNASARYFGNITKVNLQNNLSTYVDGFSMKVGFLYIF